ncbi:MAG: ankyrin repeat domain-containing protein [Planctomycetes bacterium]|nr:ankyrin repeat domain-containing protein [Planctomycetota bacterium]
MNTNNDGKVAVPKGQSSQARSSGVIVNPTTALATAVSCREKEVVKLLLSTGVDVNGDENNKCTPLHCAAIEGQVEIARLLIDAGADLEAIGSEGKTPLQTAIFHEKHRVAVCLIDSGADVNNSGVPRFEGFRTLSPLRMAVSSKGTRCLKIAQRLLEAGSIVNESPRSALMSAVANGSIEMVAALLKAGAEVNVVDEHGWSPLMYAASSNRADSVKLLLDRNADGSVRLPPRDPDFANLTAFEIAKAKNNRAVLKTLKRDV